MKRSLSVAIIIVPSLLSTSLPLPPEPEGGRILLVAPRVLLGPGLMNESVRALSMRCFSMVVDEASHVTTIPAEWSSETFEPPEQRRTSPSGLKESEAARLPARPRPSLRGDRPTTAGPASVVMPM